MSADLIKDQATKIADDIDKRLEKYVFVENLAKKAGVKRVYLVGGVVLFFVSFILFGFGSSALCNLVGFAYPLYASFKAINSECTDDDSQWLTYWVVYAFFTLVESFTDLFLYWIPLYHFIKMAFLVWCYLPQTQGALVIFKRFIDPYLSKHERVIDANIQTVRDEVKSMRKAVGLNAAANQQAPSPTAAQAAVPPAPAPEPATEASAPAPEAAPEADAAPAPPAPAPAAEGEEAAPQASA